MPRFFLNDEDFYFPPVTEADEEGLLIIGGEVTPARVLEGYRKGIFPWYNGDELPLWWSPDPRFVLFPEELHTSRSMKKLLRKESFQFKINSVFERVIENCAAAKRSGQDGTWITAEMKAVYTTLHKMGYAYSAETWKDGELVGGMYGLLIGDVFFGESMFSKVNNASKFAFIKFIDHLAKSSVSLVDCQVYTQHVETLGAKLIQRSDYLLLLQKLC